MSEKVSVDLAELLDIVQQARDTSLALPARRAPVHVLTADANDHMLEGSPVASPLRTWLAPVPWIVSEYMPTVDEWAIDTMVPW